MLYIEKYFYAKMYMLFGLEWQTNIATCDFFFFSSLYLYFLSFVWKLEF